MRLGVSAGSMVADLDVGVVVQFEVLNIEHHKCFLQITHTHRLWALVVICRGQRVDGETGLCLVQAARFTRAKNAFVSGAVFVHSLARVHKPDQTSRKRNHIRFGPEKLKNSSSLSTIGIGFLTFGFGLKTLKRFARPALLQLMRNSFSSGGGFWFFATYCRISLAAVFCVY